MRSADARLTGACDPGDEKAGPERAGAGGLVEGGRHEGGLA